MDYIQSLEDAFAELNMWLYQQQSSNARWQISRTIESKVNCLLIWENDNRILSILHSESTVIESIKRCLEEYYTNFMNL